MEIELPYNLDYREYQKPLVNFIRKGWKRWVVCWHRRAWKDKTFFNLLVEEAIKNKWWYAYILPTYTQWKKIIWDSIDTKGLKFKNHIPPQILFWENGTELKFTLANWSFIQILWSENIDNLRWISPRWIIFSEYAFQNPTAWEVMRPILAENGGWAIFNSTPNWKNHFYDLYNMALDNPEWFCQKLTVDDTKAVSKEYIDQEKKDWMSGEMIQQEYFCNFEVWAIWSYYADIMNIVYKDNRILNIPKNFSMVDIYFDLWRNDQTSVWFKQNDWMFFNFIHYYEANWKHITKYFDYLDDYLDKNNLQLWKLFLPHDSSQKRVEAEKSSLERANERYWSHKVHYIERTKSVQKDRDTVRAILSKCRFDKDECSQWIKCLENYHKRWDDKKKVFADEHEHDWSSHGADSFRYFAVTEKEPIKKIQIPREFVNRLTWKVIRVN